MTTIHTHTHTHTHTHICTYVCILFSPVTTQIDIRSGGARSCPLLHILVLLVFCLFDESHSTSRRCFLIAVLICISWLISNAEILVKYLLTIPMSSKEKCLYRPFAQVLVRLFFAGWSQRVGHDWSTSLCLFTFMHWRKKWQRTPVFLPGESQGRGSLVGCRLWGRTESDTTEAT